MKYISIRDRLYLKKDDIESVEERTKADVAQTVETIVRMRSGTEYSTYWPMSTILDLLELPEPPDTVRLEPEVEKSLKNMEGVSTQIGTFAG